MTSRSAPERRGAHRRRTVPSNFVWWSMSILVSYGAAARDYVGLRFSGSVERLSGRASNTLLIIEMSVTMIK
jgi:hypothetical protein